MEKGFEGASIVSQEKERSWISRILVFLAFLSVTGWMGFSAFGYGFGCGLGMGHGFDCVVISPYFFVSTMALLVFSFVSTLFHNLKKLIISSSIILLFFLVGPGITESVYRNLPKETKLNLDGYSVEQCEEKRTKEGNAKADTCFNVFASFMSDVRLCEHIIDQNTKERCYFDDTGYGARGLYKDNLKEDDCGRISNTYQRESCRNYFTAHESHIAGKCENIKVEFDRWFCWSDIALTKSRTSFKSGDIDFRENYAVDYKPDDCENLGDSYLRDFCYFKYVNSRNEKPLPDKSILESKWCANIENGSMRHDCERGWYNTDY